MKILYLGHSAFILRGTRTIYIDPFIRGNPACPRPLESLPRADAVVVTHDHHDHLGDAFEICRRDGAVLFSLPETLDPVAAEGVQAEGMNIGGMVRGAGFAVHMVAAVHTSPSGGVCGVVVCLDGIAVYHAGDTGLFGDMRLIGEMFRPDVALLPIGDRYTMGIEPAARAVEMIRPGLVVPMHYNTWPVIAADPAEFRRRVGPLAPVRILAPGEEAEIAARTAAGQDWIRDPSGCGDRVFY